MRYKKTKGRSEEGRVSKKSVAAKNAGYAAARATNKPSVKNAAKSAKADIKSFIAGNKLSVVRTNKNVTPQYLAGYKAALRSMNMKTDYPLARRKEDKRIATKKKGN
jgi:hypothetical protein